MKTNGISKKLLTISVTCLFILLSTITSTGQQDVSPYISRSEDPYFLIFGDFGENDWYISTVEIIFIYDPERVQEIQYFLFGEWHVYDDGIEINEDGVYSIEWFWIDITGKTTHGPRIEFKIDTSAPSIELTRKFGTKNLVKFTATTSDDVSNVERVEFYFDDEIVDVQFESPYVWEWEGVAQHFVYAITYNYAGLSEKSETLGTRPRSHINFIHFIDILFQKLQYIVRLLTN